MTDVTANDVAVVTWQIKLYLSVEVGNHSGVTLIDTEKLVEGSIMGTLASLR